MKNNQVEIQLSTDIKKDSAKPIGIKLMSRDINNNQFVLRFKSNGEPLSLSDGYTVEVLSQFVKAKTEMLTLATVYDNYAKWAFDTSFITQDDRVYNYVYVKKDGVPIVSADANAFYFEVGLSKIDEGSRDVAKYYDSNYEKVLHEFEVAINLTKEEWAQMADATRDFVDEIKDKTVDEFVELKMGEELQNLEANYATRLTGLESNDANLTAQLAQKVGQGKKAELEDLSTEVLAAIEGGEGASFNLLSIPQDFSVTPKKTTFINQNPNLWNKSGVVEKASLNVSTASSIDNLSPHAARNTSPVIEIESGQDFVFGPVITTNNQLFYTTSGMNIYDGSGKRIGGWNPDSIKADGIYHFRTEYPDANYVRFDYSLKDSLLNLDVDKFMFVKGTTLPTEYSEYGFKLAKEFIYPDPGELIADKGIGIQKIEDYDSVRLFAPTVQHFVAGEKGEIFNYGMVENDSDDEIRLFWKDVAINGNGKALLDFTAVTENTTKNAIAQHYDKMGNYKGGVLVACKAWKPIANPATIKNILCVGDSLTANGIYATEFKRRLTSNDADSFGLNNFRFIGRLEVNGTKLEAVGGREWTYYSKDNPTGAFYDTVTSDLNIKKYIDTYCGGVSLDYVSILLGMNDMLANNPLNIVEQRARHFIEKIHADYPNCKILLNSFQKRHPICYTEHQYDLNEQKRNALILEYAKLYEQIAADYAYVHFVSNQSRVDVVNNSRMATQQVNLRNPEMTEYVMDFTHPATEGYLQYADHILANFFAINQ